MNTNLHVVISPFTLQIVVAALKFFLGKDEDDEDDDSDSDDDTDVHVGFVLNVHISL
jgi:hypothetical protein